MNVTNAKPATTKTFNLEHLNPYNTPIHLLHISDGMTWGPVQAKLWIPLFVRANIPFVVLARYQDIYEWIVKKFPQIDVVFARNPLDVENTLGFLGSIKAIYYCSNTGNTIHTIRFIEYEHIFLKNKESDKNASPHKFFRAYDQIWCSGEKDIVNFKKEIDTQHLEFRKIGAPNLRKIINNSFYEVEREIKYHKILYLPSWEFEEEIYNISSIKLITEIGENLRERKQDFHLNIKPHSLLGTRNKALSNWQKEIDSNLMKLDINYSIVSKENKLIDLIADSNVFICDISEIITDYIIAASLPIFLYIPSGRNIDPNLLKEIKDIDYKEFTYIFEDSSGFKELFYEVIFNNNDYLKKNRESLRDFLMGTEETLNNEFQEKLQSLIK